MTVLSRVSGLRRIANHLASLAFFCIITLAATYPAALHPRSALPGEWRDQYQRACDVELVTWILDWDVRRMLAWDWRGLWDANIFHPARGVLTYSDHLLGAALLGVPIYARSPDPVLLYNVLFFLAFVLTAYATALLVLDLTGRWDAAIVAGLVFAYCPFRFGHINHLHLLMVYWAPVSLLCGRRFLAERSWRWLAGFIAALVAMCWTSLTLAAFLLVMLAVVGPPLVLHAARESPRRLLAATLITMAAMLVTQGPIALEYWQAHRDAGFARTLKENVIDSADFVLAYVAAPRSNRWLGGLTSGIARAERWLYPGVIATLLAVVGLTGGVAVRRAPRGGWWIDVTSVAAAIVAVAVCLIYRPTPFDGISAALLCATGALATLAWRVWRRADLSRYFAPVRTDGRGFYATWTLVATVLSFGPVLLMAGRPVSYAPYWLLYTLVPGLNGLRAPVRFHVYVMLGIAVLAGYGVARIAAARPRRARLIVATAAVLILCDSASIPLPTVAASTLRTDLASKSGSASSRRRSSLPSCRSFPTTRFGASATACSRPSIITSASSTATAASFHEPGTGCDSRCSKRECRTPPWTISIALA